MNRRSAPRRPRILLTGGAGQVGWELARSLAALGDVTAPARGDLDLTDTPSVRDLIRALAPEYIVNAAAYTAVDRAESERELAFAINAVAPGVLAEEAARLGALLVHYSTDYVFDGSGEVPYSEQHPPAPLNAYGESKLAGEQAIMATGAPALVFRTSWVYGRRRTNFLRTMLRLSRERDELRVVADQIGAPTSCVQIAEATARVLARLTSCASHALPEADRGVYHLTAGGSTSWHGFATLLLSMDPRREEQRCRSVVAIRSEDYPVPARRPAFSLLDNGRVRRSFGIALEEWDQELARVMRSPE